MVELDGSQHADRDRADYDIARTAWLETRGYRVLRFWNTDVVKNLDGVLDAILAALRAASPHPDLPPQGGKE